MTTGQYHLPATAWWGTDDASGNASADPITVVGTQTSPKSYSRVWAFDAATQEHVHTFFRMPLDYASGGSLKILWNSSGVTAGQNPIWACGVGATTPGDADTPLEHAFSTVATVSDAVNTTEALRLIESTITLNMDSAAAGDLIKLLFYRDADDAADDLTVDANLWHVVFEYTTV